MASMMLEGNYFGGEPIKGTEVVVRVEKLKKGKGGGDMVVDWIRKLCNMAFEIAVRHENWGCGVIFSVQW